MSRPAWWSEEDWEVFCDMFKEEPNPQEEIKLPAPEPETPTIDNGPVTEGYSVKPARSRVVPIDRRKYSREEADARFTELQQKHGWRVAESFSTARYWCWRIYE